jgi:hypothetical protein
MASEREIAITKAITAIIAELAQSELPLEYSSSRRN